MLGTASMLFILCKSEEKDKEEMGEIKAMNNNARTSYTLGQNEEFNGRLQWLDLVT